MHTPFLIYLQAGRPCLEQMAVPKLLWNLGPEARASCRPAAESDIIATETSERVS